MKKSTLSRYDWENYLIQIYFGQGDYLDIVIDRAYLDFCRTSKHIGPKDSDSEQQKQIKTKTKKQAIDLIIAFLNDVKKLDCTQQKEFDTAHNTTCINLINLYKSNFEHVFYYGQAQKWINMTLKYIYSLGSSRINGFDNIYELSHIPCDSVIFEKLKKRNCPLPTTAWSKMSYSEYFNIQQWVRNLGDHIPLDYEFDLFSQ